MQLNTQQIKEFQKNKLLEEIKSKQSTSKEFNTKLKNNLIEFLNNNSLENLHRYDVNNVIDIIRLKNIEKQKSELNK